jgi:hypothetical protein
MTEKREVVSDVKRDRILPVFLHLPAGAADMIDVLADVMNLLRHTFIPQTHFNLGSLKKF